MTSHCSSEEQSWSHGEHPYVLGFLSSCYGGVIPFIKIMGCRSYHLSFFRSVLLMIERAISISYFGFHLHPEECVGYISHFYSFIWGLSCLACMKTCPKDLFRIIYPPTLLTFHFLKFPKNHYKNTQTNHKIHHRSFKYANG